MILFRRLLELFGIEPERLQVSWISAAEGRQFADTARAIVEKTRKLGPVRKLVRNYDEQWVSDFAEIDGPPPVDCGDECRDGCPHCSPATPDAHEPEPPGTGPDPAASVPGGGLTAAAERPSSDKGKEAR